ncbi:MAG: class II aldolase/adducin family protein [Hyphomicrobiales bacterium]|nr:class II aldolase/adducin family protein [Hyphomicrobiales bacterium]
MTAAPALLRNSITDAEAEMRITLAAAFRVAHHLGWNDTINNHIAAKVPDEPDAFLMNPVGLGWHEIRACDLIKSDYDGNYRTETSMKLAPAGYNFHSAILREVPDVNCTLHIHAPATVVVSALEDGFQFYDQGACALYNDLGYHDFEGLAQEAEEAPRIIRDLGSKKALIMRNHGALTVGRTVGEAFYFMRRLVDACDLQARLMSMGSKASTVPVEIQKFTKSQMDKRRAGKPYGRLDWDMYFRLADQIDPAFKTL